MITAVVELPTVLDFHLAADAVAFALFKRSRSAEPSIPKRRSPSRQRRTISRYRGSNTFNACAWSTSSTQAQMSCKGKTTEVRFITWPGRTLSAMNSGTTVGCNLISLISSRARSAV